MYGDIPAPAAWSHLNVTEEYPDWLKENHPDLKQSWTFMEKPECYTCTAPVSECDCSWDEADHMGADLRVVDGEEIWTKVKILSKGECPLELAADFYLTELVGKNLLNVSFNASSTDAACAEAGHFLGYSAESIQMRLNLRRTETDPVKVLMERASAYQDSMVARIAPAFAEYLDMIIGGELRHHRAFGGRYLPEGREHNRHEAWGVWAFLRDKLGLSPLEEAVDMFYDMGNEEASYGGEGWASAAATLLLYYQGKISDKLFVDRVFSLEHNNGCILNKITWEQGGSPDLMGTVLEAHATDDFHHLMAYSSGLVNTFSTNYMEGVIN